MEKGKNFQLIKTWMGLGKRLDLVLDKGEEVPLSLKERLDEAQARYDEIMLDCPMEFRNYSQEKYKWDCQNVRDYYTRWEREDIFLTKKSLRRCRQWEKKQSLPPFEEADLEKKREEQRLKDIIKEMLDKTLGDEDETTTNPEAVNPSTEEKTDGSSQDVL